MVDLITSDRRVGHAIGFTWLPVATHEGRMTFSRVDRRGTGANFTI